MNKILLVVLLSFCIPLICLAQGNEEVIFQRKLAEKRKEIEDAKREFITTRINLTPEQATAFWPIYDRYIQNKLIIRRKSRRLVRMGINVSSSDEQLSKTVDEMLALKQEEVDAEKKLKTDLLKIINIRQLAELYRSEQDFILGILNILRDRD